MCHWEQTGAFTREKGDRMEGCWGTRVRVFSDQSEETLPAEAEWTESWKCALLPFYNQPLPWKTRQKELPAWSCFCESHGFAVYIAFFITVLSLKLDAGQKRYPESSATHVTSIAGTVSCRLFPSPHQSKQHIHVLKLLPCRPRGSSASKLAHAALIPAAERSVKFTGSWADALFFPAPCCCEWDTENQPNGKQFCFSLTELEKGRRWAIPGSSTTLVAIDENRSWIYMALSLRPGTRREDPCPSCLGKVICIVSNPSSYWSARLWGARLCPTFVKPFCSCGMAENLSPKSGCCMSHGSEIVIFCKYGDDMVKNWFSDTKRVNNNVKQGVNQKNKHTCEELVRKKMEFKVNKKILGHQGLFPEKVKIEEQNILSGLEHVFWGQHLALDDPCVFLRAIFMISRASGHYQMSPKQQSQQWVLLQESSQQPRDCDSQELAV